MSAIPKVDVHHHIIPPQIAGTYYVSVSDGIESVLPLTFNL